MKLSSSARFIAVSFLLMTFVSCSKKNLDDKIAPLNRYQKPLGKVEDAESVNASYYFLLGQSLEALGKTDDALVAYERVRALDEKSAYIHLVLAQQYLKKGLTPEGVAMARKALELDPQDRDAKLLLANLFVTAKKFSEARVLFEELIAAHPDDEEIVLYLSLIDVEEKRVPKAFQRLSAYVQRNPESAVGYFYLGRILQEQGKVKEAITALKKAVELRPGFVQAGAYLASLYEETDNLVEAQESYSWLALHTDNAQFHKKLGDLHLRAKNYEKALLAYENVERLESADLNNRVKIALLFVELKRLDEAAQRFRDVLKLSPESENIRFYLASVLEQSGKIKESQKELAKIPIKSKLYPDALRSRVLNLGKEKREQDARKLLEQAFAVAAKENLNREELYDIWVSYFDSIGKLGEARNKLEEAAKEFPGSERLDYLRGNLLQKEGKLDEAVIAMETLIRRNPQHAGALNFVGYLWAEQGQNLERAEHYIRQALKLKPKDPFITDSLGWVLYKRRRYQESYKVLVEALALRPEESVIADHLGDVLVKLGRIQDARKYYEMAIRLGPEKVEDKKKLESKIDGLQIPVVCSDGVTPCPSSVREPRHPAASRAN